MELDELELEPESLDEPVLALPEDDLSADLSDEDFSDELAEALDDPLLDPFDELLADSRLSLR